LFQLPVQLPSGGTSDHVETVDETKRDRPANLRTWSVPPDFPDKGKTTLLSNYSGRCWRRCEARATAAVPFRPRGLLLTVRLHPVKPVPLCGARTAFSGAFRSAPRFREGHSASNSTSNLSGARQAVGAGVGLDDEGPWASNPWEFSYSYRGQPVTGTLAAEATGAAGAGEVFE